MEVIDQNLLNALRELKWTLDEAKNLAFNGKVVQCDRKIQGAQVRCQNIIEVVTQRIQGTQDVVSQDNSTPSQQT